MSEQLAAIYNLFTVRPMGHCNVYNSATEVDARGLVSTGLAISNA